MAHGPYGTPSCGLTYMLQTSQKERRERKGPYSKKQWIQEAKRFPNRMISKDTQPRHITIKLSKVKDKQSIFKAARGKQLFHIREPL